MNRRLIITMFGLLALASIGMTGCVESQQTREDPLARRKAIIEKNRSKALRSRKPSSGPGNRGYVFGEKSREWMPPGTPAPRPREQTKTSKPRKQKPRNPSQVTPKRTKVRVGQ